jgi:hypothetical protein
VGGSKFLEFIHTQKIALPVKVREVEFTDFDWEARWNRLKHITGCSQPWS